MLEKIELPIVTDDGIHVGNIWWSVDTPLVRVGTTLVPESLEAIHFAGLDRPDTEMSFAVINHQWRCTRLSVKSKPGGYIGAGDMRIGPDDWANIAYGNASKAITENKDGTVSYSVDTGTILVTNDTDKILKDGGVDPSDLIGRVALIYNATPKHALLAVANAFQVSKATAAKYVREARERGLVEDRRRNKTN